MWGEVAMKRTPQYTLITGSTATEVGCVLSLDCTQGKNLIFVPSALARGEMRCEAYIST